MRSGPYNALKVDVWSLGATVWELAEAEPPFADVTDPSQLGDRWPPLQQVNNFSRSFQTFLRLCSEPSKSRPNPDDLLHVCHTTISPERLAANHFSQIPFIRNAQGRSAVLELLAQCRSIEATMSRRQSTDSHGTVS